MVRHPVRKNQKNGRRTYAHRFEKQIARLRRLKSVHGVLFEPTQKGSEGHGHDKVARFINNQRTAYKKGALPQARIDALEAIPWWSWVSFRIRVWDRGLFRLKQFLTSQPSHMDVRNLYPSQASDERGVRQLANFVNKQRKLYKDGLLSKDKTEKIEALPHWT